VQLPGFTRRSEAQVQEGPHIGDLRRFALISSLVGCTEHLHVHALMHLPLRMCRRVGTIPHVPNIEPRRRAQPGPPGDRSLRRRRDLDNCSLALLAFVELVLMTLSITGAIFAEPALAIAAGAACVTLASRITRYLLH
jgi:hypothetical protein